VPTPGYGVLLPFAFAGLWFARRKRSAWLLALLFASYAASVIGFFNVSRYRVPTLPVVFVFSAWALTRGVELVRDRRLREGAVAIALVLAGLLVTLPERVHEDFALYLSNLGAAHAREAKALRADARGPDGAIPDAALVRADALYDGAETNYRKGLDLEPGDRRLRGAIQGLLLARMADARADARFAPARRAGGLELAERLNATFPNFAEGYALRGELYEDLDQPSRALASYEKALAIAPANRRARASVIRLRSEASQR
jgi:tetratricopeptide (TPR) repeat protein